MAFKYVVLAACLAVAQAGLLANPAVAAVGASQQSTLRSLDGNSVVSTYAKQVDTPYSSVRKYDSRVTNDAVAYHAAPVAYHGAYAAPAVASYAAPAYTSYAAPAIAKVAAPVAYHGAYAAPAAYAAPVAKVASPLLGVAYSAAPAVAHISFDGFGAHYAY
ncbi:larval/pupal cuticle protein H1C-like isoform X1 [Neocloeon triangulifer]|uniref:larval/pupal cuticle protein H1C-like isoform X1 n=1 Tax=Neocloeon triangulifer TaxID=2078957 RepID=UPI00286EC1AA|nr:larval/pupal cuticle protein H1C-like isoform X1 [Neocloeon triangulifer]